MIVKTLALLILTAGAALAHELAGAHAHPHGDWSGTLVLFLAAGMLAAMFLMPRRSARRSKDHK